MEMNARAVLFDYFYVFPKILRFLCLFPVLFFSKLGDT